VGLANWKDYCYDLSGSKLYGELTSDDFALKDGTAVDGIAYVIETYGIIYNKALLQKAGYTQADITNFASLKKVADDIQARKDAGHQGRLHLRRYGFLLRLEIQDPPGQPAHLL
jgi:raffinose/stachyose/melibiose transport system substrate-binding protein